MKQGKKIILNIMLTATGKQSYAKGYFLHLSVSHSYSKCI